MSKLSAFFVSVSEWLNQPLPPSECESCETVTADGEYIFGHFRDHWFCMRCQRERWGEMHKR